MHKQEIRSIYKQKRLLLTDSEQLRLEDLLLIQLQKLKLPKANIIFSYHPIQELKEIDLSLIESYIHFRNPSIQFAYPKLVDNKGDMEAVAEHLNTNYDINKWNIIEAKQSTIIDPLQIDIVFLPLLAMDKKGQRIGYGKGYYDRFLNRCRKDICRIGFSYFEPIDDVTDTHIFDIPLHLGITPYHIYEF